MLSSLNSKLPHTAIARRCMASLDSFFESSAEMRANVHDHGSAAAPTLTVACAAEAEAGGDCIHLVCQSRMPSLRRKFEDLPLHGQNTSQA
mmetsp:Transcript_177496/g.563099  ORF Transcript_177496/g.563099 Transcript_177496/m.563099 type:complete len:91 (+) Transcript_177496:92-364(+)